LPENFFWLAYTEGIKFGDNELSFDKVETIFDTGTTLLYLP
jgi:hypothetical protein